MKENGSVIIKRLVCIALISAAVLSLTACGRAPKKRTAVFYEYFDTVITLTAYTDDEELFNEARDSAEAIFENLHRLFDIYNEYKDCVNLASVNSRAGESVAVPHDIMELLRLGKEYDALTGGSVNIAMGAVLRLWHDARERSALDPDGAALPDDTALKEASLHCRIGDVVLDEKNGTVTLNDPEMSIDVGAIAKGYAADRAAEALSSYGFPFMLNCGGAVLVSGAKPDGSPWKAGIADPQNENEYAAVAELDSGSLSTSGSYLRYFTVNGIEYGHIIDPATLYPADKTASVSVCVKGAGNACLADALSTACFILGAEEGMALINSVDGAEALFENADGSITATNGFPR